MRKQIQLYGLFVHLKKIMRAHKWKCIKNYKPVQHINIHCSTNAEIWQVQSDLYTRMGFHWSQWDCKWTLWSGSLGQTAGWELHGLPDNSAWILLACTQSWPITGCKLCQCSAEPKAVLCKRRATCGHSPSHIILWNSNKWPKSKLQQLHLHYVQDLFFVLHSNISAFSMLELLNFLAVTCCLRNKRFLNESYFSIAFLPCHWDNFVK